MRSWADPRGAGPCRGLCEHCPPLPAAYRTLRSKARPCSKRWLSYGKNFEPVGQGVSAHRLPTLEPIPTSLMNARKLP